MLDRVTLTGADDSVDPTELVRLFQEFPFVEWGILVHHTTLSGKSSPRFPSVAWIKRLQTLAADTSLALSLHICGRWVRRLLLGDNQIPTELLAAFDRIQLNFHAENTPCNPEEFHAACVEFGSRQFIFQIDGSGGNEHLENLLDETDRTGNRVDAVPLFDVSGGAGIVPGEWPPPEFMVNDRGYEYYGYAGGLGPDNVLHELARIRQVSGDCRIWLDMETRLRSAGDQHFDLAKCRSVLEQLAPCIGSDAVVPAAV